MTEEKKGKKESENEQPAMQGKGLSRRDFLKYTGLGAAGLSGAALLTGAGIVEVESQPEPIKWDYEVDVVVVGAGAAGLPAALRARELGASVITLDCNYEVGGRAIVAGFEHTQGGGNKGQMLAGEEDSPDLYFKDLTDWTVRGTDGVPDYRYNNFEMVRRACDVQPAVFEWMERNGVVWDYDSLDGSKGGGWGMSANRCWHGIEPYPDLFEKYPAYSPSGRPYGGQSFIRPLERSARAKGVKFMLNRLADQLIREEQFSGRVLGVSAKYTPRLHPETGARLESFWSEGNIDETRERVNIRARKGVIVATSGVNGNVHFRRLYDWRLTEEVPVSVYPFLGPHAQNGLLITAAMDIGASLGCVTTIHEHGGWFRKRNVVGCADTYTRWPVESPVFPWAKARGLAIGGDGWRNVINVNQVGKRFYNEMADGYNYPRSNVTTIGTVSQDPYVPHDWKNLLASKKNFDSPGHNWTHATRALNEGSTYPDYVAGPVWIIFDEAERARRNWNVRPPNVGLNEYFFVADTIEELARKIIQHPRTNVPMPPANLRATVDRYNELVELGEDLDFHKPVMEYKVDTPPFYAAECTPRLHDFYGLLAVNADRQCIDRHGKVIPGLYAGGEAASGYVEHGHGRCITDGYIAATHAAG